MSYLDCTNEEGEWMMTAAELRIEAELDALSAAERYEEQWYEFGYDDGDECGGRSGADAGAASMGAGGEGGRTAVSGAQRRSLARVRVARTNVRTGG